MRREELLEKAKAEVKKELLRRDILLIQLVNAISDIEKVSNLLFERLKEWYGIYFPELESPTPEKYLELVCILDRENVNKEELTKVVGKKKTEEICKIASKSMGADITFEDKEKIRFFAKEIINLHTLKEKLEEYRNKITDEMCPNLSYLLEPSLASKLIAKAGGLEKLSLIPASRVQILGAEKALFKHLRTKSKPPKHGVIFQHPYISTAPKKQRGKIARTLAGKIVIAVRADVYSKRFIAKELKENFEKKVREIVE